jgi:hypothetical protein
MYCRDVSFARGSPTLVLALTAEALGKPYGQSKNSPRIKESTAVREIRSYQQQGLDGEDRWPREE